MKHFVAASCPRTPDSQNYMLVTYIDDPEPWEKAAIGADGRGLADNIRNFWQYAMDNDLVVAPHFVDPQADRSDPERARELAGAAHRRRPTTRASWSTASRRSAPPRRSATSCISACSSGPAPRATRSSTASARRTCKGITIVCRESLVERDPVEHPLASQGDELDATVLFDNVLIPWKYVFHIGNPDHAKLYPQRVFDWGHYYALVRQAVRAELLGRARHPDVRAPRHRKIEAVQSRLARIIAFQQTTYAHVLAAEDQGFYTPGGLYKPDIQLFNWGRVYFLQNFGADGGRADRSVRPQRHHVSDRAAVARAGHAAWFEKLNKGATGEPYDRSRSRASSAISISPTGAAGCSCSRISTARRCRRCCR